MDKQKKIIAITGSTGGLGCLLAENLAKKYDLILVDRNFKKSSELAERVKETCPDASVALVTCDMADFESVRAAAKTLAEMKADVLLLNAGIYNVPIEKLSSGYNNVFQVNFLSQYYLATYLAEHSKSLERVVAVSSIAHRYGKTDERDIDFSSRKRASKIYGNSKRFLTFALYEFFKGFDGKAKLSIAHPGVTLTNMTNHYPKFINPIVKLGIKLLFPSPKKAIGSILRAVEEDVGYMEWIGPGVFDVWGAPKKSALSSCSAKESERIGELARAMRDALARE